MVDLRGISINFNLEKLLSGEAVVAGITKQDQFHNFTNFSQQCS